MTTLVPWLGWFGAYGRTVTPICPYGVASLKRVGAGRVWISIPPTSEVEGALPLRHVNYTGLPRAARLLPLDELVRQKGVRVVPPRRQVACMVREPNLRMEDELLRRCRQQRRCNRNVELTLINVQAEMLSRAGRLATHVDEELALLQRRRRVGVKVVATRRVAHAVH